MDERAPGAAVAVGEGVDRLELGVGDAGLHERRQLLLAGERDEVVA